MYSKLKMGDLLYRQKGIVQHLGVYLGNKSVLHNSPSRGARVTTFEEFADKRQVKVRKISNVNQAELVGRLSEILGQNERYSLLGNNCEHIANYLLKGRGYSPQLQATIVGLIISGFLSYNSKSSNLYLSLALGAAAGLLTYNIGRKYDDVLLVD
ncbi:MAG TPA: lecithin retinol acyltransferase family protein [Kangiella sp.]